MRRVVGRKRFLQINPYSGYLDTLAKFTLQHYACRRPGIPENRGIYFVLGFKYAQILLPYRYFFNPRPPGTSGLGQVYRRILWDWIRKELFWSEVIRISVLYLCVGGGG